MFNSPLISEKRKKKKNYVLWQIRSVKCNAHIPWCTCVVWGGYVCVAGLNACVCVCACVCKSLLSLQPRLPYDPASYRSGLWGFDPMSGPTQRTEGVPARAPRPHSHWPIWSSGGPAGSSQGWCKRPKALHKHPVLTWSWQIRQNACKKKKEKKKGAEMVPTHTEHKHPLCYFEMLCAVRGRRVFQLNAYMPHREEYGVCGCMPLAALCII